LSVVDRYLTDDNVIMVLFALFVTGVHTVYPRLMLLMYGTEFFEWVDHLIKIISNLVAFHDRSLTRNLVFNTIRCMGNEVNNHIVFN
jgi:hypothetical protein